MIQLSSTVSLNVWATLAWGAVATTAMTAIMQCGPLLGLSRLSIPFLCGTAVTAKRSSAMAIGSLIYMLGGLIFAFAYALCFETVGAASWWLGTLLGLTQGLFVVAVFLPLLPYIHPRVASEHDGPTATYRIEPPGPFGLHYGQTTPLVAVAAHAVYGAILGTAYSLVVH